MHATRTLAGIVLLLTGVALGLWLSWGRATEQAGKDNVDAKVIDAAKYASLQAAIDALPDGGGVVRLPPGTLELTAPLIVTTENTRIEGAGASSHLINKNEKGEPALVLRPKDLAKKKNARSWRVQLADFRISGNPKSGDGVLAEGVNEIYVHGMSIDHHGGHGINLVDCYEDPRICDCILTYNKQAGLNILRGHDIVVNGNQFEENLDALRCLDSFNLCMTGNNLDDHLQHGVVIENTYGSVLSGNMIEECNGTAVIIDRDCYGITVSANVIAHNMGGGIDLKGAWGCAISANTFTIVKDRALVVGPKSGRITISGNNFSNSYLGGGKVKREDPATGIVLQETADITISGNTFTGLAGPAIVADAKCQRLAVTGNIMSDLYRKAKESGPALVGFPNQDVLITSNLIEKAHQGGR